MDKPKKKLSAKAKTLITIGVVLGVLLLVVLIGFLILHGYISKIQYDPGTQSIVDSIPEDDDGESSQPDSPASDINDLESKVESNYNNNKIPLAYDKDVFNIMLIGSDTRISGHWSRSDTMMLVSINKKTHKIIVTSLLRDIYVQIPEINKSNRLNAATAFGGPALLLKTVEENFRVKVDRYMAVDFFLLYRHHRSIGRYRTGTDPG